MPESKVIRVRRKQPLSGENVKHRRKRSGCFTCRKRRVKCDEARPTCERCRKGGRDCTFPEPHMIPGAAAARRRQSRKATSSPGKHASKDRTAKVGTSRSGLISSSDEDVEEFDDHVFDDDGLSYHERPTSPREPPAQGEESDRMIPKIQPGRRLASLSAPSETPSLVGDKSPTPSTEGSVSCDSRPAGRVGDDLHMGASYPSLPLTNVTEKDSWSHLSEDLRFYLNYHNTDITPYTYSFRLDARDFMKSTFLELAMQDKPLLYAVAAFSAYLYAVNRQASKIENFYRYYQTSLSLLRQDLKNNKQTIFTLLTILQLATLEEYLGDFVNLFSHQKAAFAILTKLCDPSTVMRTEQQRAILEWYGRFEVVGAVISGYKSTLNRDWLSASHAYYLKQSQLYPTELGYKIDEAVSSHRLLAWDMSILFAKIQHHEINLDEFLRQNAVLDKKFAAWLDEMDPALKDPRYLVTDFGTTRSPDPEDIVNPFLPGVLYSGPLWRLNFAVMQYYTGLLAHKYHTAVVTGCDATRQLVSLAMKICHIMEAIEFWPGSPPGSVLATHNALGLAALFLPKDRRHSTWLRRKFAMMERLGLNCPVAYRKKFAAMYGVPETEYEWWLPGEEMPEIHRHLRQFVKERDLEPQDTTSNNLREMKAIFGSMSLRDNGKHQPTSSPKIVSSPR